MISYYVDAGLFLTPLLKNQPANVVTSCEDWLRRIATGATQACTSWLTWDEVTYIAGRIKGTPFDHTRAAEAGRKLAAFPNLRFVAVDDVVVTRASGLLQHLRPRDSIHASTAILHTGGRVVTVDGDFGLTPGLSVEVIRATAH